MTSIKETIINYAESIGIEKIGFASTEPFTTYEQQLLIRKEKGFDVPFEEKERLKRIMPELTLKNAKTFIVIVESYKISEKEIQPATELTANISVSAAGLDYHTSVMEKLTHLDNFIFNLTSCQSKKFVDQSPFSDRQVASRAGIGFFGRNTMLIHPDFGSRFFIGYILTDLEIQPDDDPDFVGCGKCQRCVQACPTGAIIGDGTFNGRICISYLTQHKGNIDSKLKEKMGKQLYGCDICQKVCPYNKHLPNNRLVEPIVPLNITIEEVLNLSNREFKDLFGKTAAGWRGKKWLQRNAIIALGNSKSLSALPILEKTMKDRRIEIREETAWALSRIKESNLNNLT